MATRKSTTELPQNIRRQILEIKEGDESVLLLFINQFQKDRIKETYGDSIKSHYHGRKVAYEVKGGVDITFNFPPEVLQLFENLRDKTKRGIYLKETLEDLMALFSNLSFLDDCQQTRKLYIDIANSNDLKSVYTILMQKGSEERDYLKNRMVSLHKEVKLKTKKQEAFDSNTYFEEVRRLNYLDTLLSKETKIKDLTGATYISESDSVRSGVVEPWVNHYPPLYLSLCSDAIFPINELCENYGLRQDIYGDILMDYIFFDRVNPSFIFDFPNNQIPSARILYSDLPNGMSEFKIQLYHDSSLEEVRKLLETKWEVIQRVQRDLLPPEKWKGKTKESIEALERDTIIVGVYNRVGEDYKRTLSALRQEHGISISRENLRKIISRNKKEQERISTKRSTYDLQYLKEILQKKPLKKGGKRDK